MDAKSSTDWRSRRYGKILGADLKTTLHGIQNSWKTGQEMRLLLATDRAHRFWGEVAKGPHWWQFYRLTFAQVVGLMGQITGTIDLMMDAANSEYPSDLLVSELNSRLDASEPGDDPRTLPLILTFIANLDSIARYSLSVNDLVRRANRDGCVASLARAASIDTGVLALPEAQLLMKSLQMSGATEKLSSFLQTVAHGPHKSRLVYPDLRWAEYLLRDQGAFDACTQDEIHELIVVHLKLYDGDSKLKDSKKALFMLFRKWRKESGI